MRQVAGAAWVAFASDSVLALAAGAAMLFLLAVVLVATSRRTRRRKQQTPAVVGDLEVAASPCAELEEVTDVRVLHAHIRILEEALEQETTRVPDPALTPEAVRQVVLDELHRRIRSTVRGLSARMEDDPTAVRLLARVEAAVDRLMPSPAPFVRPALTVGGQVAMLPTEAPPAAFTPTPEIALEEAHHEAATPEVANAGVPSAGVLNAESPNAGVTSAAPVSATPVGEEPVLPIPARTPSAEIRRGRRWLNGSAA